MKSINLIVIGLLAGVCWVNIYGFFKFQNTELTQAIENGQTRFIQGTVESVFMPNMDFDTNDSPAGSNYYKNPNSNKNKNSNKTQRGPVFSKFLLRITHIEKQKLSAWLPTQLVIVTVNNELNKLKQGNIISGYLRLKNVTTLENIHGYSYYQHLLSNDVVGQGRFETFNCANVGTNACTNGIPFEINSFETSHRQNAFISMLEQISRKTPPLLNHALIIALITGNKRALSSNQRDVIQKTGVGHLFAVSGLHIGIAFWVVYLLVNGLVWCLGRIHIFIHAFIHVCKKAWLGKKEKYVDYNNEPSQTERPKLTRYYSVSAKLVGLIIMANYVWVIGAPPSAIRAYLALILIVVLSMGQIKVNKFRLLFSIAALTTIWNPLIVLEIGWQLSFFAVLGILIFLKLETIFQLSQISQLFQSVPPTFLQKSPEQFIRKRTLWTWLKSLVLFQGFITIWMMPLIIIHFQQVALLSVLNNLAATPIISLIVMPCLVIALIMSQLQHLLTSKLNIINNLEYGSDHFSTTLFRFADFGIDVLWRCLITINKNIEVYFVSSMSGYLLLLSLVALPLILTLLMTLFTRSNKTVFDKIIYIGAAVLVICLYNLPSSNNNLVVFDVGHGSGALLTGQTENTLIDLGPVYSSGASATKRVIQPALTGFRVNQINHILITHYDADHKGAPSSLDSYTNKSSIFDCDNQTNNKPFVDFETKEYQFQRLWPLEIKKSDYDTSTFKNHESLTSKQRNDNSCVIKVTHKASQTSILFSGDITYKVERQLVAKHYQGVIDLKSDIMLSPHHGSGYSSTLPYLYAVKPNLVIHDTGYNNRFGFPKASVIKRYARYNVKQLNTGNHGQVIINLGRYKGQDKNHGSAVYTQLNSWTPFWKKQNPFSFHGQIR